MGFAGACTRGWARPGSKLWAPASGPGVGLLQSWLMANTPTAEVGQRAVPATVNFAGGERWRNRAHSPGNSSSRGTLSGSLPAGKLPPRLPHRSEAYLGTSAPTTKEQTLPLAGGDSHGAKRRPRSRTGLLTTPPATPPVKGIDSQPTRRGGSHPYQNSPHTQKVKPTQATQGCPHINTDLQDHSR